MLFKLRKNKKGFTLIELIVVVAILAILAAIAVPNFIGLSQKANNGVEVANAASICGAVNVYNALGSTPAITAEAGITQDNLKTLWPAGISSDAATKAIDRIGFVNGIAVVDKPSTN
jgi:type IV pilus assembly protein PilA